MRIFNHILTIRRVEGPTLEDELRAIIVDENRAIRPLIAKVARSAAKDFLGDAREVFAELAQPGTVAKVEDAVALVEKVAES